MPDSWLLASNSRLVALFCAIGVAAAAAPAAAQRVARFEGCVVSASGTGALMTCNADGQNTTARCAQTAVGDVTDAPGPEVLVSCESEGGGGAVALLNAGNVLWLQPGMFIG